MAKTISELPAAAQANDTDEIEVTQSGTSRKLTRAQLVAGLAIGSHGHTLADITDAGALAGLDLAAADNITDGAITPVKLDRSYAELDHSHQVATSGSSGYMSASDKSKLDGIQAGAEVNRALASQAEAEAGTDNASVMTPLRTAQAVTALAGSHSHSLVDITDAGALAGLDEAAIADLSVEARSRLLPDPTGQVDGKVAKIVSGAWVIGDDQVGEPGSGEANTAANIGTDGVGVADGKVGTELQFRHIASVTPALSFTLDDAENDIDAAIADVVAAGDSGLMSGADKTKLDGIEAGAEANPEVVPQAEAEAGTATTERIWTAERVAQAIDAQAAAIGHSHDDGEITAAASATNYVPSAATVEGHLSGIDDALGTVSGGGVTNVGADDVVTVGDGAIISEGSHSEVYVDGTAVKARRVRLRHATTQSDPVTVTVDDGLTKAVEIYQASDQTGTCTIQRQTSATINGVTSIELFGAGAAGLLVPIASNVYLFKGQTTEDQDVSGLTFTGSATFSGQITLSGGGVLGSALDAAGSVVQGALAGTGTATGTLAAADSGKVLRTTGNVTIPQTAGFNVTLIAGGAHTLTFGATSSAAMAAGDVMSIVVDDTPAIHASLVVSAAKVSFS